MTRLVGGWLFLRPHAMALKITFPDRSTGCDSERHHIIFRVLSSDMTLTNLGCPGQSYHMIVWDLWLAYCKMITELLWCWSWCGTIIKSWLPEEWQYGSPDLLLEVEQDPMVSTHFPILDTLPAVALPFHKCTWSVYNKSVPQWQWFSYLQKGSQG